jgi:hypothetical protein
MWGGQQQQEQDPGTAAATISEEGSSMSRESAEGALRALRALQRQVASVHEGVAMLEQRVRGGGGDGVRCGQSFSGSAAHTGTV